MPTLARPEVEPTTGLHLADVAQLLGLLDRLVDARSTLTGEHLAGYVC